MTGNRIWRVETSSGPAVQKLYGERAGILRSRGKTLIERLLRLKSTSSAPTCCCSSSWKADAC